MANANFFSPDGGITRYPLEDTEGRTTYEDGIDGINLVNCDSPDVYMNATKSGTADNFTVSSTSAGTYRGIGWHIPVKPNTSYTISADVVVSSGSGYFAVRTGDNKSQITALNIPTSSDGVVLRFNSGSETMVRAYVYCTAGTSESGSVTYKDYKITETRFEEVPYRPYNQQSIQHQINNITGVTGVRNFLKIEASTQTSNGVTFTINKDSNGNVLSVGMNGTATADATIRLGGYSGSPSYDQQFSLPIGNYELVGCPSGGGSNTYYMEILKRQNSTASRTILGKDFGNGFLFSCEDNNRFDVNIVVLSGQTVSNLIVKPMIKLASDPSDEYVPYAMTNRELTEVVTPTYYASLTPVSDKITAGAMTLIVIGEICILNGWVTVSDDLAGNTVLYNLPSEAGVNIENDRRPFVTSVSQTDSTKTLSLKVVQNQIKADGNNNSAGTYTFNIVFTRT